MGWIARAGCIAAAIGWLAGPAAQAQTTPRAAALESARRLIPDLPAEVTEAACAEGSAMVYTLVFRGNLETLARRFRERFPCLTLRTFTASGGVLAQRFTSEFQGGASGADIWMNSSPLFGNQMAEQGMLAQWTPPGANRMPALWKREGSWYAIGLAHIGVAWNTQEVDARQRAWLDNLRSWDQLAQAPFAGSLGIVDIRAGGTTQLPYYYFEQNHPGLMRALAAMRPTVFNAINPLAERLGIGEFAFAPAVTADTAVATQRLNGSPLQWTFPEPGLAVPYFIGISARAPHPNAARLLMAWSLTDEGQAEWVSSTGLAPARPGVRDDRPYAREPWYRLPTNYYQADWNAIAADLRGQTTRFTSTFGN